jgi:hypothetical protein
VQLLQAHTAVSSVLHPAIANLETWPNLDWSDGVQIDELDDTQTLLIETRNTIYEAVVMDARRAEVLIRGGKFFPVYTRVHLAGASLGGSFLKLHGIYVGFSMELCSDDGPIITSAVRRIALVQDGRKPS